MSPGEKITPVKAKSYLCRCMWWVGRIFRYQFFLVQASLSNCPAPWRYTWIPNLPDPMDHRPQ